jgi:ATP-dependent Clp protease ATP-binding subunit ClpA
MLQHELETALARKLLAGEVRDGSHVLVDAGPRGLELRTREGQRAAA